MLSGTTNDRIATEGFRALERTTGVPLADLSEPCAGDRISFRDAQVQPRTVLTSPEWSGIEAHGRRYSPFTINVEREKPWHTLSGRMHFYVDHAWMLELGEGLPVFRPPLVQRAIFGDQGAGDGSGRRELTLKYLTPHSKWSIHSEYRTTCTCSRCSAALTELQGKRGGTDNSLTHIVMKPTHFIGGYGQLSYAFNYYGPTGSQRDEVTVLRKREAEVRFQ